MPPRVVSWMSGMSPRGRRGTLASMSPLLRRLVLVVPGLVIAQLDAAITLYGQPALYWSGDRLAANEASPTFFWLLTIHPAAFEVGVLAWLSMFAAAIVLTGELVATVLAIAVALGHAFGIATWLMFRFDAYQAVNGLMLFTAVLLGVSIHIAHNRDKESFAFRGWSAPVRFTLVAVMVAIGVYLFLVPH